MAEEIEYANIYSYDNKFTYIQKDTIFVPEYSESVFSVEKSLESTRLWDCFRNITI